MLQKQRSIGIACLAVTSLGWGLNWPTMKAIMQDLPPLFARGASGVAAAAVLALLVLARGQSLSVPRHAAGPLAAASFFNVFAWMGLSTLSLQWLHVGQAALLVYTMPIWAALLSGPLLGRRLTARHTGGLAVCLAGLATLFGKAAQDFGANQRVGVGLALAAALLFAWGTVRSRPVWDMAPLAVLAWQLGLGSLPMVLIGVLLEDPVPSAASAQTWQLMAYMTAVPMGLCYLTWFAALRHLPPATASVGMLVTPVVGVGAAAITLGEPFGLREAASLLLVLGGVAITLGGNAPRR